MLRRLAIPTGVYLGVTIVTPLLNGTRPSALLEHGSVTLTVVVVVLLTVSALARGMRRTPGSLDRPTTPTSSNK